MGKLVNRIPEYIQDYIDKEGINRSELARRMDVSPSTITLILQGKRGKQVQLDIVERLCLLLEITPNDLLWQEETEQLQK